MDLRELFAHLLDDAALFPPGNAPMDVAVHNYVSAPDDLVEFVGPFVIPASRIGELENQVTADQPPVPISLIAPAIDLEVAAHRARESTGALLRAIEVSGVTEATAAEGVATVVKSLDVADVPVAVELPRSDAREGVLEVLAAHGLRAKLRTGGLEAALFPSPDELAQTIVACMRHGVPFKCTAGLHHAVRHADATTGFVHHGFLNVLAAAEAVTSDRAQDAIGLLEARDPQTLVELLAGWSDEQVVRTRAASTSFGTCSVAEPVDDLRALGLIA